MFEDKFLKGYLTGEGSEEEKKNIKYWFNNIYDENILRKKSFSYWEKPLKDFFMSEDKADQLLDRIHHQIGINERFEYKKPESTFKSTLKILTRIAAVLFIPLAIYFFYDRANLNSSEFSQESYSEIICPPGTRTAFFLPDGSKGYLNNGSSIVFPSKFIGDNREVKLQGEAFFDVKTNPDKPFVVKGKHIDVTAYGTSFNIMSYQEENKIEVTLIEGKVEVTKIINGKINKLGVLNPGQKMSYNPSNSGIDVFCADIDKTLAWIDRKLVFDDDCLDEMVRKFSRWYNVDIIIRDNELRDYTYVGSFQNETLDEVLKVLSLTAPIDFIEKQREKNDDGTFRKREIELFVRR
jgi:transmembrane sensor